MSCRENACSPGNTVDPDCLASVTAVSNNTVPVRNVVSNVDSSPMATLRIRSTSSFNSGYWGAMAWTVASISCDIVGSPAPRMRMLRITRRIRRRSTYPRPSLPGTTPSPIRNVQVRA